MLKKEVKNVKKGRKGEKFFLRNIFLKSKDL